MGDLLLNTNSVLMCPHGAPVIHIPTSGTSYRVAGRIPMLLGETYTIAGCPHYASSIGPCLMVIWLTASPMLIIKGQPILTLRSAGICQSSNGVPMGPVIITNTQTGERESDEFTVIDY